MSRSGCTMFRPKTDVNWTSLRRRVLSGIISNNCLISYFLYSVGNCRKLLNSYSVVTYFGELFCKNCYVRLSSSITNREVKGVSQLPTILTFSAQELNRNCCAVDDSIDNKSLNKKQYQFGECRLRGGGSEVEETNICVDEEKNNFLENQCATVDIVNSMTICDPPPSPAAVTTWYNRQHSKLRGSTLSLESQRNNTVGQDCGFEAQDPVTNRSELKTAFSNNEVNITEARLSAEKAQVTSINRNKKINKYDPVCEFSVNSVTIPSRRKFTYPPVPPSRNPLPSRRRVSFCDVVIGDTCENDRHCSMKMQDAQRKPCYNSNNEEYSHSYDIWQADDPVGRSDGGYENIKLNHTEDTGRMHFGKSVLDCCDGEEDTSSKCNEIEKNRGQDHYTDGNSELHPYRTMNEKDGSSKEETVTYIHQNNTHSSNNLDSERMRGGCGSCGPRPKILCGTLKPVEITCHCTKREPEPCRAVVTSCACSSACIDRRGCCPTSTERPACKKPIIRCRQPCQGEPPACGSGGCCGSGCRGGCGKPGETCLPARPCTIPPCRPCSPCSPPRPCPPLTICCCGRKCANCCSTGGSTSCCRSKSPICRVRSRRCYSSDRSECPDGGCCRPKPGYECLGGGLDCQRCGRKVYQAEMQIIAGAAFHNTCFSCYCCRKPLEPLTYQENCGEIYCKQCYTRNFGPQGYGYGAGPGALQTPM